MTTEDLIIISMVTEINKVKGSVIDFSSDYRKEEDGVHCYVKFRGALAGVQESCTQHFVKLSKEERLRAVELVMRQCMNQLPKLTMPDEFDLIELFNKELQNENTSYKKG